MYFLIEDDDSLEEQDKVSSNIKKELDSELVYNKKILKYKIKSYGNEATDFRDK